ncbi:MAG: metallophosphoesterase [Thermococcus sp.]|nr:metallophosphoesterase [Thermococcus sp.]
MPSSPFENLYLKFRSSLGRVLLIADPHIGFEMSRGIRIRTHLEEKLADFINDTGPDLLIILGDLKDPLGMSFTLKRLLMGFFSELGDTEVVVTKGNHDGKIEEIGELFPNVKVVDYFLLDGKLFLHGHTKLPDVEFEEAYLGHIHPTYSIVRGGVSRKAKVFMRAGKFLVLPTINPYIEGFDIREGIRMVPFLRHRKSVELFLPEGVYLGTVSLL